MTRETILQVSEAFAREAKAIYGEKLYAVILFGSCARGDFQQDSDIDFMVLLNIPHERVREEARQIREVCDRLDWEHGVLIAPVTESVETYNYFMDASGFFQNVNREGIRIA